jgi:hypothetical protein
MGISQKDEALLIWFFERGVPAFWRSTQGTMLERAHSHAYDSAGHRIPRPSAWSSGNMMRPRQVHQEASYEPEEEDLIRVARVSRRLRIVRAKDARAEQTIEAYYGGTGARWNGTDQGRIFALYPLTAAGERFVRAEMARRPGRLVSPHDGLLEELQLQAVAPTEQRRELFALIRTEADACLRRAWDAWDSSAISPAVARAS